MTMRAMDADEGAHGPTIGLSGLTRPVKTLPQGA